MLETFKVIRRTDTLNEDMDYFFLLGPSTSDNVYDIIKEAEITWWEGYPDVPLGEHIALAIKDSGIKIYGFLTNETRDENEYYLSEV